MASELHKTLARRSLSLWSKVAQENGWCVRALTVWIDENRLADSVGVRDGDGSVYVVDYTTDELLEQFPINDLRLMA